MPGKLKLNIPFPIWSMAVASYGSLFLSIVFSLILFLGCIPPKDGALSLLKGVYAVRLTEGSTSHVYIANFALCAEGPGTEACAITAWKDSAPAIQNKVPGLQHAVNIALRLQRKCYYGNPAGAALLLFIGSVLLGTGLFWSSPLAKKMKNRGIGFVLFGITIMVIDIISTRMSVLALTIASEGFNGMDFEIGTAFFAFQLIVVAFATIGVSVLWWDMRKGKGGSAPGLPDLPI